MYIYLGRCGALWEILPTLEWLISEIKVYAKRYKHDEMSRFHYSVQLGWQKLDEYYTLTDNSPAYVASICLHPRYKWKWIEEKWAHRMDGIKSGVRRLWEEYKRADLSTDNYLSFQPKRRREATRLDDFIDNDMSDSDSNNETMQGEYNKWMNQSRERKCEDPIEYWHSQRYNIWRTSNELRA
jgi:hypothetical protein